jgi:hypothetical protein
MNRDDIIRMAREAFGDHALKQVQDFAAFAYDQGVAAEREACAKVCEDEATIEGIAQRCAAEIRKRGEK